MVMVEDESPSSQRNDSLDPDIFGAVMEDIDVQSLDEETQRFVLETHMENLGLFDFLGVELGNLASQYSDYDHLPNVRAAGPRNLDKLGDGSTFVTLIKSFMGIGILTMPYAIKQGGYVAGPLGLIGICFLEWYCIELLITTSQTSGARTVSFGGLGEKICGRWAKTMVNTSLLITQFGVCVAYVVFISANVADVVCHETRSVACPAQVMIAVGMLIWVLPFCLLKTLSMLAVPMLMSNFAILGVVAWVFYCAFAQLDSQSVAPEIVPINWDGLPVFFGCVVFAFEGIGLIMPIQAVMAEPAHMPKLLKLAMICLCVLYTAFGFSCYLGYGVATMDMVTFNIPQGKVTSFLRLFYCFGISFTYPVMIFPIFGLVESRFKKLKGKRGCVPRVLERAAIISLTGVIAMNIPNFGLFLGLIGSLACSALAFVFPALFHMRGAHQGTVTGKQKAKDVALILFGSICGVFSFGMTLISLIEVMTSDTPHEGGGAHR